MCAVFLSFIDNKNALFREEHMSSFQVPFAFEVNGEAIDPTRIKDTKIAKQLENIVESVVDKVGDLKCPEHDEAPKFICSGPDFDDLNLEVLGCCDKLVDIVKAVLSS